MTERKRVKTRKIVEGVILKGKTVTQAAIDTGSPPRSAASRGSEAMHSPEGREIIEQIKAKYDLGLDRAAREIDKGLKQGKLGTHSEYLEKVMRINKFGSEKEQSPSINLFLNFANKIMTEGIIEVDGTISKLPQGSNE